ncbi:MAG: hypothetical protein LUC93_11630 [Planctomycetaceae bacterium]|nr:hypothetical protein [Planctomycetaceae bacterium]
MRKLALALILTLAATVPLAAGESVRLNFVKGLYSVNVPSNWYVDIDASDSTLTIAQGIEPTAPRVIVAIPNPKMANQLDDYARLAATSFINALGGGNIVQDKGERNEHGIIFRAEASGMPFVGAVHTIRDNGYAILTIFLTRESDYDRSKEWASVVLDSLRVDARAVEQQTAFITRQADNLIRDLQGSGGTAVNETSARPTTPSRPVTPSARIQPRTQPRTPAPPTRDTGGLGSLINDPWRR